jgi:hypothetical protein
MATELISASEVLLELDVDRSGGGVGEVGSSGDGETRCRGSVTGAAAHFPSIPTPVAGHAVGPPQPGGGPPRVFSF